MSSPKWSAFSMTIALAAVLLTAACDDDPTAPTTESLVPQILVPDTVGNQEALRVVFPRAIDPRSALDPANFVVINVCNGLRVPGALRLAGDTLIFSPSTRLPFLTPLAVRIQNILDLEGRGFTQPVTFNTITERPPVSDVSWEFLNSPTGDEIYSTSFISRDTGYLATNSGKVFRTINGGQIFAALFKDEDITGSRVRALRSDTLYMTASVSFAGATVTTAGLFRSTDGGLTFSPVFTRSPSSMRSLTVRRVGNSTVSYIVGDIQNFATFRFDERTDSVHQFGPTGSQLGLSGHLSRDGSHAIAVGIVFAGARGSAYRSADGGRTMIPVTLPSVPLLTGAGFINNNTALVVGDSSTVIRVNAATGATTVLGAANGIPQTEIVGESVTVYQFTDVEFAPGSQVGWIVGAAIVRRPGLPNFVRGVILMSRDGGQTFVRQAISGATNNGLDFPAVLDIEALSEDFATLSGSQGLVAARKENAPAQLTACTFEEES